MLRLTFSFLLIILAIIAADAANASEDFPVIHLKTDFTVTETAELKGQSLTSLVIPENAEQAQASFEWLETELSQNWQSREHYKVIAFHVEGEEVDPKLLAAIPEGYDVQKWAVKEGFFKKWKKGFRHRLQKLKEKSKLYKDLAYFWGETTFESFLNNDKVYRTTFALVRGVGAWSVLTGGLVAGEIPKKLAQWVAVYPAAVSMGLQFKADWWTNFLGKMSVTKKSLTWGSTEYIYLVPIAAALTYFGFPPVEGGMGAIASDINMTVLQAMFSQAPWDFAIADKKKYEIAHGPRVKHKFYEFKASITLLGISLASIGGAAMRMVGDPGIHDMGEVFLLGLGAAGVYQYIKVNWEHNHHLHDKVKMIMGRFKPSTLLKAKHCASLLTGLVP